MTHSNSKIQGREIIITRLIKAPRELIFEVWTSPEHIKHWYGPNGFTTTTHEMNLTPGGVWDFTLHGPDGRDYHNRIKFIEIIRPEKLVYKHTGDDDTQPVDFHATVTFEENKEATLITMRSTFASTGALQRVVETYGAEEGAKQMLSRLDDYLVSHNK
ncbi:MAG: SRPBCC family protein [Bacteroidota bacterium]